jgi:tetratricopeptide (TPR) repeat protein
LTKISIGCNRARRQNLATISILVPSWTGDKTELMTRYALSKEVVSTGIRTEQSHAIFFSILLLAFHIAPTYAQVGAEETLSQSSKIAADAMRRLDYAAAEREYLKIVKLAPQVAEIHNNLGLACYLQGKLEPAAQYFQSAAKLKPSLYAPNYFLARIRYKQGKFREALPFLERALKLEPENIEACRQLASTHVALKAASQGIAIYRSCLKKEPRQMEVLYDLGVVYMNLAAQSFDRVAELPGSAFSSLIKASHYANLDESGLAERGAWIQVVTNEYRTAIQKAPLLPELRAALGTLEMKEGNWEVANELFEQELRLDSSSYLARYGLAETFFERKDYVKAVSYLNEAARIRPEFFEPFPTFWIALPKQDLSLLRLKISESYPSNDFGSTFLLAAVAAQLDESPVQTSTLRTAEKALLDLKGKIGTARPAQTSPQQDRREGLKLLQQKRYEAGIRLLLPLAKKAALEAELLIPLARALLSVKEYDLVDEILRSYADRHSGDPEPYYLLGISYQSAANEIMQTMVSTDPNSYRLRMLMGDALFARERFEEAAKEYQAALSVQPSNSDLHLRLGRVYHRQAKYEEALAHFKQSVELDPRNAQAQLRLGDSLLMAQKAEEAVLHLSSALDLDFSLLDAHAKLGKALAMLSRFEEAVSHLERASYLDRDGSLHYQMATLYRRLGKEERAAASLKESQRLRSEELKKQESQTMEGSQSRTGRGDGTPPL